MATVTVVSPGSAISLCSIPTIERRPILRGGLFAVCDALALALTATLALFASPGTHGVPSLQRYLALWPALAIVMVTFACCHLYPGVLYNAVSELRSLGLALTMSFLAFAAVVLPQGNAGDRSIDLLLWWIAALIVIPCLRSGVRDRVCHRAWWGIPVAVFHTGEASMEIVRELEAHPEVGLRPVVILASPLVNRPRSSLPVLDLRMAAAVRASGVERGLIVISEELTGPLRQDFENRESTFPRLMIFHPAATLYNLTTGARHLSGRLAVEVRRDLLLPLPRLAKRCLDLSIVALGLPMVTLIILIVGLLVRLESPGPVFFAHRRIGRDRATFNTWKIRTMHVNGVQLLQKAMAENPDLRTEWSRDRKLRRDPRVTRMGRFLRKTSLDELPQFWNVLRGEMSLVGPRPIVEEEVAAYGANFSLYCRVTPGLTGLWQVSGRSDVSSGDRVRLDSYYVRNWSPWLDLHILARTARVVLTGQGAY